MTKRWVPVSDLLSSFADDLDDERALEEAERTRRAQLRAAETVQRAVASRPRPTVVPDEPELDVEEEVEDDLAEGYL